MSNDTIFREVDEELRGDRMRALWKRFGPYVIGAAVAIVVLVAANEGWSWWQNSQSAAASDKFYAALDLADGGDLAAAEQAFADLEKTAPAGYATLARFREAGLLAKQGKTDEAVAAYDALATSESNAQLKALALVFGANLFIDRGDVAEVEQRVQGLMTEDNPMRNAAREALGLAQYKAGDLTAARQTLMQIIADPRVSREMQSRIELYVAQLTAMGAGGDATDTTAAQAADAIDAAVSGSGDATAPSVGDQPAMDVTEPAPTEPAPAEPAAVEPAPVEPAPVEPAPVAPATSEPAATAPVTEPTTPPPAVVDGASEGTATGN